MTKKEEIEQLKKDLEELRNEPREEAIAGFAEQLIKAIQESLDELEK